MANIENINSINSIEKNRAPGKLVVISGPAGSGKGTVLKELFGLAEYKYSVSATTRSPRNGEADGVDYYFLSQNDFMKMAANGEMLEYVEYSGNYYGTPRTPVEKMLDSGYSVILELEVKGAVYIKEKLPQAVMIFLTPPTYFELEKRLRDRGTESGETVKRRLEISKKEIACIDKYDYLVINDNDMQRKAAFEINCIVEAEKNKTTAAKTKKFLDDYFGN